MSEKEPSVLGAPPTTEPPHVAGEPSGADDAEALAAPDEGAEDGARSDADVDTDSDTGGAASSDGEADGESAADLELESDPGPEAESGDIEAPDESGDAAVGSQPAADVGPAPVTPAAAATSATTTPATRARRRRSAPTFYVAGFWRRIGAALIDLAVVLPVAVVLVLVVSKLAGLSLPPGRNRGIDFWLDLLLANDPAVMGGVGLTLAICLVYVLVFQIVLGYTLGMRALKIRIIDVYGDRVSTGRSIARTAGYVGCLATLSLGFLWIGFDAEKRGLHDWVSGTYVVKA